MFRWPLTDQAYLKMLEPHDAPALFAAVDRNRARLREWLPWLDKNTSEKDSFDYIEFIRKEYATNKGLAAGIWLSEKLVGVVSYNEFNWSHRRASLGYWISAEAEGRGLITLATRALTEYAFKNLKLNLVEIRCATGNVRSQKVPERLGFTFEGVLRQREWLYDRFVDHRSYTMLASEWRG